MFRRVAIIICVALLLAGCATRMSTKNPFLSVATGDAYVLEGDTVVNEEGETVCAPGGDCIEVRGGNIGENAVRLVTELVEVLWGLLPRGDPS